MEQVNIIGGLIGGGLIGCAASILFVVNGKIAGISGMLGTVLTQPSSKDKYWCLSFLVGLVIGAAAYSIVTGGLFISLPRSGLVLLLAGFLVGVGTSLGSGCTSGHSICGIARLSKRSFVGTIVFMASAIVTALLVKQVI